MTITSTRAAGGVVLVAALTGGAIAQQPARPDPIVREGVTGRMTEHVYVIPDGGVPLVPTIGIIVGSRGILVIDTGLGARNGEAVLREVAKIRTGGDLSLATTHVHPEHDLGAGAFPATTRMIRSHEQEQEIADSGLETAQRFSGMSAINADLLKGAAFRTADVTFEKEYAVDLGGVRVRLMAVGPNHTRGDTVFYVEPDGVLFSGDVVMSALPSFGSAASSLAHWLESLDLLEALQPTRIVPSHGPIGDIALIERYRTYLVTVRSRTATLKGQGRTLDETVTALQNELGGRYDAQRMVSAIRTAYGEAP